MKSRSDESWRERNPVERNADVPEVGGEGDGGGELHTCRKNQKNVNLHLVNICSNGHERHLLRVRWYNI